VRSMVSECPWLILHHGHTAWYQRSLLRGDFKPGLKPNSWYIVWMDGRAADPYEVPRCVTCNEVPRVQDLEPVEVVTGQHGFLDACRQGSQPWPRPTREDACWWCNTPGLHLVSERPPICRGCAEHLKRY
jgi:hypothetical protein